MNEPKIYCYFLLDPQSGNIKIGQSGNPSQRIAQLELEAGHQLIVLAIVEDRIPLEQLMHLMFAHCRISGDWFEASPELLHHVNHLHFAAAENSASYKRSYGEETTSLQATCEGCGKVFRAETDWKLSRAMDGHKPHCKGTKTSSNGHSAAIPEILERNG